MAFANGILFFVHAGKAGNNPTWGNNQFRYNILENIMAGIATHEGSGLNRTNTYIFNNTVSSNVPPGTVPNNVATCIGFQYGDIPIVNNICITTLDPSIAPRFYVWTNSCETVTDYNEYWSPTANDHWRLWPNAGVTSLNAWQTNNGGNCSHRLDPHSLHQNPLLSGAAGTQGTCYSGASPPTGPQTCSSPYELQTGSPLIGAGMDVGAQFGVGVGGRDFYGNAIPNGVGSGYNIGADGGHH
jgi:hypothetical protein